MDQVVHDLLAARVRVHRPCPIWALAGISRCAACDLLWPCWDYCHAVRALRRAWLLPRRSL